MCQIKFIDSLYRGKGLWCVLIPLSWLLQLVVFIRRLLLTSMRVKLSVPVIIVGNITLGGTGKTPLVIRLAKELMDFGYKPGIISRGYRSKADTFPLLVTAATKVELASDEPLLMARSTNCPVVIDRNRIRAANKLISDFACDVIISDDGLQYYRLHRDLEIAVIDGMRGLGSGRCLPAGALREPAARLKNVDFIVINGEGQHEFYQTPVVGMEFNYGLCHNLIDANRKKTLAEFKGQTVHAVAGVGNPNRFFQYLSSQGINIIKHPLPDHHDFQISDLSFDDDLPIIMTEKDAVKCSNIASDVCWSLSIEAVLEDEFFTKLQYSLQEKSHALK